EVEDDRKDKDKTEVGIIKKEKINKKKKKNKRSVGTAEQAGRNQEIPNEKKVLQEYAVKKLSKKKKFVFFKGYFKKNITYNFFFIETEKMKPQNEISGDGTMWKKSNLLTSSILYCSLIIICK
ncbi:hydrolase, partial [Reticulomyxa filosa]